MRATDVPYYQFNHVSVYFYGGVYDDSCVYIADIDTNLLLKLDIHNRELEIVASLKNKGIDCCGIQKMDNKIMISYRNKSAEIIVNIGENNWAKKDVDYFGDFENDQSFEFKENMYIFDKDFGIRKFDSEFKNIDNFALLNDVAGIQTSRISETKIAIITENGKVMEFDLSTEKMVELELPQKISGIETICYDGENYWVTTHNWEIIKFNLYNKDFQRYLMPSELENIENQKDKRRFEKSFFYKEKIWVIPYYAKNIMCISTQDGMAELVKLENATLIEYNEAYRRNSMQYISVFCETGVLLLSCAVQQMYYLDFEECRIDRIDLHSNWRKEDIFNLGIINEGMLGIGIKQFLDNITSERISYARYKDSENNDCIWNQTRSNQNVPGCQGVTEA
ncbi:MAG: hypothetical protein HFJ08_06845 [Lachnospiraceae bacterium]|nr:hypothetical protein [Lachnospiraceae bacterium]